MKIKKLLHKYVPIRTRLLIKVVDGLHTERLIGTDMYGLYHEHTDLLDYKILQIEVNDRALCIIVEERSALKE